MNVAAIEADLRQRWCPSDEQVVLADALLAAGYDQPRGARGEYGVCTPHLLVNKSRGWWNGDVEVEHLDGVFLTRDAVSDFLQVKAAQRHAETGQPVIGGYAWHSRPGQWAVWEDGLSEVGA